MYLADPKNRLSESSCFLACHGFIGIVMPFELKSPRWLRE